MQDRIISVHGVQVGTLEVCYLEERKEDYEGPFLAEERQLLNSVAELLGRSAERREAERALKESESRIRSMSNNLPSAMIYQVIVKSDGTRRYTYFSDSVRHLHGVSPEEAIANPVLVYDSVHEDDIESLLQAEVEAIKTFSTFRKDVRIKNPLGGNAMVSLCINAEADGRWFFMLGRNRD